jgi:alkylation response protein AidB-like acyl-CoA dehydrogenase
MTLTTSHARAEADTGFDAETLKMTLEAIGDFVAGAVPEERQLQLDHDDECPVDVVRGMCSDQLGVQLLFIPEDYGGMGGGTLDVYRLCEHMARLDLGIATSVFATFLGSDPIFFGATAEQKQMWLSEMADKGILYAFGATELRALHAGHPDVGADTAALACDALAQCLRRAGRGGSPETSMCYSASVNWPPTPSARAPSRAVRRRRSTTRCRKRPISGSNPPLLPR